MQLTGMLFQCENRGISCMPWGRDKGLQICLRLQDVLGLCWRTWRAEENNSGTVLSLCFWELTFASSSSGLILEKANWDI